MHSDGKPTLMSLASELGVSRQTVSNVINSPHRVREETRERVLDAIRKSGYRPSAVGRALRTRRSMNLALKLFPVVDGINGAVMDRFVHSLTVEAQRRGYRIVLFTAKDDQSEIRALDEAHQASTIDGAVLTDTSVGDARPGRLQERGIDFVAFGRPWGNRHATHAWVDIDGSAGTAEATAELRRTGHTRIGFIGWPAGSGVGDDRRDGWRRAIRDLGPEVQALDAAVSDGARSGAQAAQELRDRGATAVVCASDSLALGAAGVYRQDVSAANPVLPVIGFDDTPVAQIIGLSSLAQPVEQAASVLINLLLTPPAQRRPDHNQILLTPTLQVRNLEPFAH